MCCVVDLSRYYSGENHHIYLSLISRLRHFQRNFNNNVSQSCPLSMNAGLGRLVLEFSPALIVTF